MIRKGRFPVFGAGGARRSMVYVGNLVQGVLRAELTPGVGGRAYWIADERAYTVAEIVKTVQAELKAAGLYVVHRMVRIPNLVGTTVEKADRLLQGKGVYHQQIHVLGEMNKTIACDITAAKEELGYAGVRSGRRDARVDPLVPGSGPGAVRALVTGGSGYFGELLVDRLAADGMAVRVLDLNDSTRPAGVELVQGDVRGATVVRAACDGVDVVFNNVAQVPLAKDEQLLRTVNVDGTDRLLRAAQDAGVSKVVHTSSSAVFGVPESNPVFPSTTPAPREAYGRAKLAAEYACWAAVGRGLDVSIVRPRTILGHGRLGIFGILFDWIADGADVFVLGSGDNRYQFVHADDLADIVIRAGAKQGPGLFNAGTDRFCSMRESLESVVAHAQTGSKVRSLPARPASWGMHAAASLGLAPFAPYHWIMYSKSMWFDIEHAREQLGWQPRWSNQEMFAQSYDWFVANRATVGEDDHSVSHHRTISKQGALRLVKRLATR
ncbi:MAG: NAD-dependent epimerase/dehydratase family protein [Ilumatobacteraceae bacterium]